MDWGINIHVACKRKIDGLTLRALELAIQPPGHESFQRICWS